MNFEEMLADKPDDLAALSRNLRQLVQEELPDTEENVYGGKAVQTVLYSIGGTNHVVCGFQPSDKGYCIFYLHHLLPEDSDELKLEGKGGGNRHVKVSELNAEVESELRRLVQLARSRGGAA